MDIQIREMDSVKVVEIVGDIDGETAPVAQEQINLLASPGSKVILDLSRVPYMSSAGLRMLLVVYRHFNWNEGRLLLAGLPQKLKRAMTETGFLEQFALADTVEEGVAALS
jgi:anti-sigma B factor antagonist